MANIKSAWKAKTVIACIYPMLEHVLITSVKI